MLIHMFIQSFRNVKFWDCIKIIMSFDTLLWLFKFCKVTCTYMHDACIIPILVQILLKLPSGFHLTLRPLFVVKPPNNKFPCPFV